MSDRKRIFEMKRKEFWELPERKWNEDIGPFNSLVILPCSHFHESGWRNMDFVAVDKDGYPICRLSGCSDVINFDGIGGHGKNWLAEVKRTGSIPTMIPVKDWAIDCLPCGYLHVWANCALTCGGALSSFELFAGSW